MKTQAPSSIAIRVGYMRAVQCRLRSLHISLASLRAPCHLAEKPYLAPPHHLAEQVLTSKPYWVRLALWLHYFGRLGLLDDMLQAEDTLSMRRSPKVLLHDRLTEQTEGRRRSNFRTEPISWQFIDHRKRS